MEILKTKNYKQFILVDKNREGGVCPKHVDILVHSIQARNMLEFKPIECDSEMRVMDGQHRLKAAERLGVDIYYTINPKFQDSDMITLNINKNWTPRDFLNFYVKSHYPEYIKLDEFVKKNAIDLRIAIKLTKGNSKRTHRDFKMGTFTFNEEEHGDLFDLCWQTIDYIKRMNGVKGYLATTRFWNALIKLIRHVDFNKEKWFGNLTRMIERIDVRATEKDYLMMFMEIHNWHNLKKVDLIDTEY
jgi:hypothetical protein